MKRKDLFELQNVLTKMKNLEDLSDKVIAEMLNGIKELIEGF